MKPVGTRISIPAWSRLLSVGNPIIDGEHRAFLEQVGRVVVLLDQGDASRIRAALAEVVENLKAHFESEERIFGATAYPAAAPHVMEHRVLYHMAYSLVESAGGSDELDYLRLSVRYLAQLMVEHLVETDMGYKPYLGGEG